MQHDQFSFRLLPELAKPIWADAMEKPLSIGAKE
jgi:hypothetical protein